MFDSSELYVGIVEVFTEAKYHSDYVTDYAETSHFHLDDEGGVHALDRVPSDRKTAKWMKAHGHAWVPQAEIMQRRAEGRAYAGPRTAAPLRVDAAPVRRVACPRKGCIGVCEHRAGCRAPEMSTCTVCSPRARAH